MKAMIFFLLILLGCNAPSGGIVQDLALGNPDNYPIAWDEYGGAAPTIILLGDSRIDFMPVEKIFPGQHVVNLALGGTTSVNTLSRVPFVKQFRPDIIILSVGINDISRGWQDSFPQRIKEVLSALRAENPDAKIYYTGVVPPISTSPLFQFIGEMNSGIENSGLDSDSIFINTNDMIDAFGGLSREYASDEVHYNDSGYNKLSEIIWRYL
jgi:lysophospholipase L1-like esterase